MGGRLSDSVRSDGQIGSNKPFEGQTAAAEPARPGQGQVLGTVPCLCLRDERVGGGGRSGERAKLALEGVCSLVFKEGVRGLRRF